MPNKSKAGKPKTRSKLKVLKKAAANDWKDAMADIIKTKTKKGYDRYHAASTKGEDWMEANYEQTEVTAKKSKHADALELAAKAARLTISEDKSN
jgi:hypothetical protein